MLLSYAVATGAFAKGALIGVALALAMQQCRNRKRELRS